MPTVIALTCPVCGAPLRPGAETCTFCGSYIVIKTDLPKLERRTLNQAVIQEHIAAFRKRVRADQYDEEAHYGLGIAYYNLGLVDYAVDELTSAARLMPENPHIHAQLAVALRDLVMRGGHEYRTQLDQHIDTTLQLDPENLEVLSIRAELLALHGYHSQSRQLLERISRLDTDRGRKVAEAIEVAEIQRLLDRDEWPAAKGKILQLKNTHAATAKALIKTYIGQSRDEMPLLLAEPSNRDTYRQKLKERKVLGIFGGIVLLVLAASMDAPPIIVLLALASVFVIPSIVSTRLMDSMENEERLAAISIRDGVIDNAKTQASDLIRMADGLYRCRRGQLLNLEQAIPLKEHLQKKER